MRLGERGMELDAVIRQLGDAAQRDFQIAVDLRSERCCLFDRRVFRKHQQLSARRRAGFDP